MFGKLMLVVFQLVVFASLVLSAKILFISPTPQKSHNSVLQPVYRELSLRGHNVTAMTVFPLNDPSLKNLTEGDWSRSEHLMKDVFQLTKKVQEEGISMEVLSYAVAVFKNITADQFEHPIMRDILGKRECKFDLVVIESIALSYYYFAEKCDCPLVLITSMPVQNYDLKHLGNPDHPVLYPDLNLGFTRKLTFYQRVVSVFYSIWFDYQLEWNFIPTVTKRAALRFGSGSSIGEIQSKRVSVFIETRVPVFHPPRALIPGIVSINGLHIKSGRPLSKNLRNFLDSSTTGVIYFALGSNVKSSLFSKDRLELLTSVFSQLPCNVLFKYENSSLPGKYDNVRVEKWMPQQDILRHPNVKVFVTQGGLQSVEEGLTFAVPMLGLPFFGDQFSNARRLVEMEVGEILNFETLTKESLKDTLLKLHNDPKYKRNIDNVSKIIKDQPTKALDSAIWWIEYVIRHKGATHLRSPARDIPTYQYYLLDVIGTVTAAVLVTLYLTYIVLKASFKAVRCCVRRIKLKTE